MAEELPFKVVRANGHDEVLAQGINLLIAHAAYEKAAELYLRDRIELRQGARIVEKSKPD
jgi:hypothetical protein